MAAKKLESTTQQKVDIVLMGIQQVTGAQAQKLNPDLYPGAHFPGSPKPVAYYQFNFDDGESFLIPIFTNKR